MYLLDRLDEFELAELYRDKDEELLERLTDLEREYLMPHGNWLECNPEERLLILEQTPSLGRYFK